ncbi:MAG: hypothetical protein ACJASQ_000853 [Crocinitomicaceae bacterium]|jgi:hypothetical protein
MNSNFINISTMLNTRKLILSSLIVLSAFLSNAQAPTITIDNSMVGTQYIGTVPFPDLFTHNFASEVIETTPTGVPEMINELHFTNETTDSAYWIVSRRRISVDTSWNDFLCWGHESDPFGGQCIDGEDMDSSIWEGPCLQTYIVGLAAGEYGKVSSHIFPNLNQSGCGTYRYYVGDCNDPFADSVDISICFSVGIDALNKPELLVKIAPNPANDHFKITSESPLELNYSIANSLGQVIDSGAFINNHSVATSRFENGIYFVKITNGTVGLKTERIIINH